MRPNYPPFVAGESWAHPLAEPEQGCLLLARQEHAGANGGSMHFFSGAVILITSHDEAHGTVGYVLNKPSPLLVDELQVLGAATGFKQAFGSQRLHLGGPVHLDHVTLLHRFVGIARSHKITEGIFMGGLPEAIRLVNSGIAQPSDFQLVLGMSGWAAGQLREEIRAGYWHVISASPDLVLPTAAENAASSSSSCYSCSAASPSAAPAPSTSSASAPSASPSSSSSSSPSGAKPKAVSSNSSSVATATAGEGEAGPGKGRPSVSPMYRRIARLAVRGA
ncbi:hypothetical protein HYH03_015335 [Edaphochlamys debaryana]|uniref:YqgE/AlgH family protein n=1 Tax=Edaphochlamys debaryana TaxID=47281 RepID=A0A835XMG5_9CHLO|nr:hypothetical protein HYH03_015335 [Edaphochlamys debaryana]|eukprot:KAG2486022.1 hypothetical protein HYH03_015335 [Edaphochlamys debaryana]